MCARKSLQFCGLMLSLAACGTDGKPAQLRDAGAPAPTSQSQDSDKAGSQAKPAAAAPARVNASQFPGSGTGNAGAALGGSICDAVVKTHNQHVVTPATKCMNAKGEDRLAATLEQVLECVDGKDTVHLRLTFDPSFVDNTYGKGSIGWPHKRGHTLVKDLTKSDHAEITVTSSTGATSLRFKLDYITELASAPSGFGSLGARGGDGGMLIGNADWIVQWNTSLSRNLNERGYGKYTVDSPLTDAKYTPNPDAPEWDYRVVYEAWIDVAAFGGAGFGDASIAFVHASPAKGGDDTLDVEPGDCPGCQPDDPKCAGTAGVGGSSSQCQPDDPKCAGTAGFGGSSSDCQPDDPKCAGTAGFGGSKSDCGPDDPQCTGQGGIGGMGGAPGDCAPDDEKCWKTGGVAGAPEEPPAPTCPPDQPGCSPV
ncbi:MAG TPA: hypothetical protein VFN67_00145 [Polyangiales bacterium]|nr:hypothetical protein [Polyangiales bacterium]